MHIGRGQVRHVRVWGKNLALMGKARYFRAEAIMSTYPDFSKQVFFQRKKKELFKFR